MTPLAVSRAEAPAVSVAEPRTTHYSLLTNHYVDRMGNVKQLTSSGQTVTDTYDTDGWGANGSSSGSTVNPFRFGGQFAYFTDSDSGLLRLGVRYLDPVNGRFTQRDPVDNVLLRYTYARNDPSALADPSGLEDTSDACAWVFYWCERMVDAHDEERHELGVVKQGIATLVVCLISVGTSAWLASSFVAAGPAAGAGAGGAAASKPVTVAVVATGATSIAGATTYALTTVSWRDWQYWNEMWGCQQEYNACMQSHGYAIPSWMRRWVKPPPRRQLSGRCGRSGGRFTGNPTLIRRFR